MLNETPLGQIKENELSIYLIDRINKLVKDNFFTEGCGKKYCDGKYGIIGIKGIVLPENEYGVPALADEAILPPLLTIDPHFSSRSGGFCFPV